MTVYAADREGITQAVVDQTSRRRLVNTDHLAAIAAQDVRTLIDKDAQYGSSWKKRGGVGAFMMAARKWDRLETLLSGDKYRYDIFAALQGDNRAEGVIDDIRDLRAYLLLIESEMAAQNVVPHAKTVAIIDPELFVAPANGISTLTGR